MDFDYVTASPGNRWADESASRRRQRRLSSPSLRAYLTPAFDAVAAGDGGGVSGYSSSSSSSGGLDLGFDASLLRYSRARFAANADLDSRRLLYSPQSAPPPPPPQARTAYPAANDGIWAASASRYSSQREAGRFSAAPGFQDFEDCASFISTRQASADHLTVAQGAVRPPADLRPPEGVVLATKAKLSTPKSEAKALSRQQEPIDLDDERITQALYGHSGKLRLPIFREICPE